MANPMDDSAAATVSTSNAKICPTMSSKKIENVIRFTFTARSMISRHIKIRMMCARFNATPANPIENRNRFVNTKIVMSDLRVATKPHAVV